MASLPKKKCSEIYGKDAGDELCSLPSVVPAGTLGFSVMLFLITSVLCFMVLTIRRIVVGGELGGPIGTARLSAGICFSLWVIYITFSILNAVGALG